MMPLFIFEAVILPAYILSLKIFHKYGLLTENLFGLIMVSYLSIMALTASHLFPAVSAGRIIGLVLSVLCWFPGYSLARRMYKRVFPRQ
jgi:hypothetical protein